MAGRYALDHLGVVDEQFRIHNSIGTPSVDRHARLVSSRYYHDESEDPHSACAYVGSGLISRRVMQLTGEACISVAHWWFAGAGQTLGKRLSVLGVSSVALVMQAAEVTK